MWQLFWSWQSRGGGYSFYRPSLIEKTARTETIIIDDNMTGSEIGVLLAEKGLIPSDNAFKIALYLTGKMDKLQKGYYEISSDLTMKDVIALLQRGDVKTLKITIPEGFTVKEIARLLEEKNIMSSEAFLDPATSFTPYMYMYGASPVTYRTEGFLFPSTYEFMPNVTADDILKRMAEEMNRRITPEMRRQIEAQKMTIYEFLTLASLVEKEALVDEDRPIIAAVFKKRLSMSMPLQSCASIQYILGYAKPRLSIADTEISSPYNTYLHAGLPPGPIANPGLASMKAVLEAPPTEYVFFVADKKGKHHFTKTYEEHLAIVEAIYGKE